MKHLNQGRRHGLLVVALAAALTFTAGCSSDSSAGDGGAEKVKIGHLAELTGAGASVGIPQSNAIKLAVKQINADGGFDVDGKKFTIDLVNEDDKSDATAGVTAVQKIRNSGAKYMVGTTSSAVLGAYLPIVKDDENFISMIVGAAAAGVTDNVSIYRPRVTLTQYTAATIEYFKANHVKSIAMITDSQHAGYVAETPGFKASLKDLGIDIVAEGSYKLGATDFSSQLTTAIKSKPELLNVRGFPADVARVIKQARELGYDGKVVTNTGLSKTEIDDAQAGSSMANVVDIVAPITRDIFDNPTYGAAAKAFSEDYEKEYNTPPGFTSASAYTAVKILVRAFEKAGTVTDIPKVRDALDALKISDVDGIVDSIEPGEGDLIFTKHQADYQMVVREYADGDFKASEFITVK